MHVGFYSSERLYGFAELDDMSVYFHLGVFVAGRWPGLLLAPPPILGEEIRVQHPADVNGVHPAPRAQRVERVHPPQPIHGRVDTFNPRTGWGFVQGDDGTDYYLHRAEVEDGRLPLPGQEVDFYRGHNRDRPRACHVRVR